LALVISSRAIIGVAPTTGDEVKATLCASQQPGLDVAEDGEDDRLVAHDGVNPKPRGRANGTTANILANKISSMQEHRAVNSPCTVLLVASGPWTSATWVN